MKQVLLTDGQQDIPMVIHVDGEVYDFHLAYHSRDRYAHRVAMWLRKLIRLSGGRECLAVITDDDGTSVPSKFVSIWDPETNHRLVDGRPNWATEQGYALCGSVEDDVLELATRHFSFDYEAVKNFVERKS